LQTDLGHGEVGLVRDDRVLHLDAHLIVLVVGGRAGILLVGAATLAATVVEDGDHGSAAGLEISARSEPATDEVRDVLLHLYSSELPRRQSPMPCVFLHYRENLHAPQHHVDYVRNGSHISAPR